MPDIFMKEKSKKSDFFDMDKKDHSSFFKGMDKKMPKLKGSDLDFKLK